MALAPGNEGKRVKVYELKNNDWYDRGTGFCAGTVVSPPSAPPEQLDARIFVTSEDDPNRRLLATRITKDDGYQKQQETLIVWTENNGVDMALSFQEAEGCTMIWDFVSDVQSRLVPEDGISDDLLDQVQSPTLPEPQLGRLDEVENVIRGASTAPAAREALVRFMLSAEQVYILKLGRLVSIAEELESLPDLHKLCTIMKLLILMNDSAIIENIVTDEAIMGVLGALEYDPEFPSHRANHRQYLSDSSKFKEVVKIQNEDIRNKIHYTYRLLYLKDVVLARILDDPTFSVLNSLIFFHQVDIVNHLQSTPDFLNELFAIFDDEDIPAARKKDAVLFIQNCCAVSKNIQPQSRAQLYQNFIGHGLFNVITFSLRHHDASIRVAGTDVLVSLIDHDVHMVRSHIFKAINEKTIPLTDTLIELLLLEVDLGVKSQMADAIKILLDPSSSNAGIEMMNRQGNSEMLAKQRGGLPQHAHGSISPQTENFIGKFYEEGAKRLFQPLKDLEFRPSMNGLTIQETSLFTHLIEMLCFFVRQHPYKSKVFILGENLHARIAQLLSCPQKYMKLIALKWFRTCIALQDDFHSRQIIQYRLFEPILNIVYETMPRDNLLNSNCLELFEYIKREHAGMRHLFAHLVETYRERLMAITYVDTFHCLVLTYDRMLHGATVGVNGEGDTSFTTEENTPDAMRGRMMNGRQIFSGLHEPDPEEEAYFHGDDDIDGDIGDDDEMGLPTKSVILNGASPVRRLVNYPDDDDDEPMDILASSPDSFRDKKSSSTSSSSDPTVTTDSIEASPDESRSRGRQPVASNDSPLTRPSPSEPVAVKRRRADDEEDEDELGKMMGTPKRRHSSASFDSAANHVAAAAAPVSAPPVGSPSSSSPHDDSPPPAETPPTPVPTHGHALRRKGSLKVRNEGTTNPGRHAIKPIDLGAGKNADSGEEKNGGAG